MHTSPTVPVPGGRSAEAEPEAQSGKETCLYKVAMLIGCVDHVGGGGLWSVDLEVPAPLPGQC